jgi:hypothetical protein
MKCLVSRLDPTKAVATLALGAALVMQLFFVSAAGATITTVGRPLTGTFTPSVAKAEPFTGTNWAFPDTGGAAFSPIDGAIIRWNITGAQGSFRLGTLTKDVNQYTLNRLGDVVSPQTTGNESFPAQIPIAAGELVGVEVAAGSTIGTVPELAGASIFVQPALTVGQTKGPNKGPSETLWGFNAEVLPPPTISTIAPTSGSTAGGTAVTISGQNFAAVSAVRFGSNAAKSFTTASETTINAVAPAGTGSVPITVTTPAGTVSASSFAYTAPPAPPAPPVPTCTVPRLRGKTLKAAKTKIRGADCKVGKLTKRKGATAKTGEVVAQVPKPGATVPASTQVKVTLAP